MTKNKNNIIPESEIAFNNLPFLPPNKDKIVFPVCLAPITATALNLDAKSFSLSFAVR